MVKYMFTKTMQLTHSTDQVAQQNQNIVIEIFQIIVCFSHTNDWVNGGRDFTLYIVDCRLEREREIV